MYFFIAQWGRLTVHEVDGLRKETFLVSGCSVSQCSVTQTRRQFREEVAWMWGVQIDFFNPFPHYSSWRLEMGVPMILSAVWKILCSWAKPDSYKLESRGYMTDSRTTEAAPVAGWTSPLPIFPVFQCLKYKKYIYVADHLIYFFQLHISLNTTNCCAPYRFIFWQSFHYN